MQESSTDQHLSNLQLSYKFYKQLLTNNLKILQDAEQNACVQEAVRTIVQISNYVVIKDSLLHHASLKNTYLVMLELDWIDFFDYFELLDALIFNGYDHSQWSRAQSIIVSEAKYQSVIYFGLAFYALRKMQRIIPLIFFEMYRDQYGINHYQNLDLESLKEKDFMTKELVYKYFLSAQDVDAIKLYLEYEEKNQEIKDSAASYLKSIELVATTLYEKYGEDIHQDLNSLLNKSYYSRLNSIYLIRKACHSINTQRFYDGLNYESFFNLYEFLTFRSAYPDVLMQDNREIFYNKSTVDMSISNAITKFGTGIEASFRNLYCYLFMLENLVLEYMKLHFYVHGGKDPQLGDLTLETAMAVTQASFPVGK